MVPLGLINASRYENIVFQFQQKYANIYTIRPVWGINVKLLVLKFR